MKMTEVHKVLERVMKKLLDRHKTKALSTRSFLQGLRTVYTTAELHRLIFVLSRLPDALKGAEEEILLGYRHEMVERLQKEHLFVIRGSELRVVRRPEILASYSFAGRVYVALSERRFLTGKEGELEVVEIGDFLYLPKPDRSLSVGEVHKKWGVDDKQIETILDTFLLQDHNTLKEGIDIFKDEEFVLLRYTSDGAFVEAFPPPPTIPQVFIRRGRSSARVESLLDPIEELEVPTETKLETEPETSEEVIEIEGEQYAPSVPN